MREYFKLSGVCVVTSNATAYYAIVSRLRKAGIPFSSLLPDSGYGGCQVVLTTRSESGRFGAKAAVIDELDDDPGVFKGQIVSRLSGEGEVLAIGVDPGSRIGMAAYYGKTNLAFRTFDSVSGLCSRVSAFVNGVPSKKSVVRIGNGNPAQAARIADWLGREAPGATIEVVDESGTSARSVRMKGVQGDQGAAAKIAFRKGEVVSQAGPRTHGQVP